MLDEIVLPATDGEYRRFAKRCADRFKAAAEITLPLAELFALALDGNASGIAEMIRAAGHRPDISAGIHGYITRGYGRLDLNGFWQYPLPDGEYVG